MQAKGVAGLLFRTRVTELATRWRGIPPVILLYHGVIAADDRVTDWTGKHINSGQFSRQLELLSSMTVLPLDEMVEALARGRSLRNSVAITFDDGYLNNVTEAVPVLKAFGMPATFFLSTGYIGKDRWMWTDELENALAKTDCHELRIGDRVFSLTREAEKIKALLALKQIGKALSDAERACWVGQIKKRLNVTEMRPHGHYRFMNWEQANSLKDDGFSVGAHTVNHPILSRVPVENACQEIEQSQDEVASHTGSCSRVFCYPNGKLADFTEDIVRFCRRRFIGALSTVRGAAQSGELFRLRRIAIDNSTGVEQLAWDLARLAVTH